MSGAADGVTAALPAGSTGGRSNKGKGRSGASGAHRIPAMTPTLAANKLHDGTPILSQSGSALAHAVSTGLRPMRLDVNSAVSNVEVLTESVAGFGTQLQTQGKMLEQLAKTVHTLKAETTTGINEIKQKVGLDKGDAAAIKAEYKLARANQAEAVRIRARLRAYAKQEAATTELTRRAYLNADQYIDLMHIAIEDELMLNEEDARAYAMSRKVYPARKSKTVSMRARSLLMRTRSHTVQGYKEILIPVYFEAIGVFKDAPRTKAGKRKRSSGVNVQTVSDLMDQPTAQGWLSDEDYIKSDKGYPAIIKTLKEYMIMQGAESRVIAPKTVGGKEYIDCTLGHFAIVCAIIRGELEKAAGIKSQRRSGIAGGIFAEFAAEVARVDEYLPMHDVPADGLRLVDGGDENRGKLDVEESAELLEEEALDMSALEAGVADALDEMEG